MIELDVTVSDPAWESDCDDCEGIVRTAIDTTWSMSPVAAELTTIGVIPEISVVLGNDDLVQTLNREYRNIDKPTNVLSFAQLDGEDGWEAPDEAGPATLGDLVLGLETVRREAGSEKKAFADHFTHLVVHGMLHLLGYDHIEDDEAEEMESLEIQILARLGIRNPYEDSVIAP